MPSGVFLALRLWSLAATEALRVQIASAHEAGRWWQGRGRGQRGQTLGPEPLPLLLAHLHPAHLVLQAAVLRSDQEPSQWLTVDDSGHLGCLSPRLSEDGGGVLKESPSSRLFVSLESCGSGTF